MATFNLRHSLLIGITLNNRITNCDTHRFIFDVIATNHLIFTECPQNAFRTICKTIKKISYKLTVMLLVLSIFITGCTPVTKKNTTTQNENITYTGLDDSQLHDYVIENLLTLKTMLKNEPDILSTVEVMFLKVCRCK